MKAAQTPADEAVRLQALKDLNILDTAPEERYDRITRLTQKIFNVPICVISLVDSDREWFKSCVGLDEHEGPRAISFCGHTINEAESLVIEDTSKDERFKDNPMVVGPPYLRFYAGVVVRSATGAALGAFCIKDTAPRVFTKSDLELLKSLAAWVEVELNLQQVRQALIEREKLKAASETSERFLDQFVKNLPMMLFVKEAKNLTFVRMNKAGEDLLGLTEQELIGKNDYDFFPKEQADFFVARDREVLNSGKVMDIAEERIQTKAKGERVLHTKKVPILDQNGNPAYLLGISEDITNQIKSAIKQKEVIDELERMNKLMIGRELKMVDLKKEISRLKGEAYEST